MGGVSLLTLKFHEGEKNLFSPPGPRLQVLWFCFKKQNTRGKKFLFASSFACPFGKEEHLVDNASN